MEELEEIIPILTSSARLSDLIISNVMDMQTIAKEEIELAMQRIDIANAVKEMILVVKTSTAGLF